MVDFFISYNSADKHWAMGIGDWLDQAGYTTVSQQQDFVPATNFAAEMHKALQNMERMILVLSPDYLSAKFPLAEWTSAFASDPACEKRTLIPVRVRDCKPDGLLRPIVYIDLVNLNADDARKTFLNGIESVIKGKRSGDLPKSTSKVASSGQKPKRGKKSKLSQNVKGNNNTTVQADKIGNLTIKMTGKKAPSIQPLDVVGANVEMRAYLEYLVSRYMDWRMDGIKRGIDTRPFHPSMIHRDIKREFGARTYLVPQGRFQDLVDYLHERINDTIKGRNNPHRNFHSYEEHLELLHGKKKKSSPTKTEEGPQSIPEILVGALQSGLKSAKAKAIAINCISNLKQIGTGARIWANDNGCVVPPNFSSMEKLLRPGITCCPSDAQVRYNLLSPGAPVSDPSIIYAHCPVHNNIVLVDGSAHMLGKRKIAKQKGVWRFDGLSGA